MSEPPQATPAIAWPRCGASAAVFRAGEVLLVQRGKGLLEGRWSLPGGHIEPGERAKAAALREVREEAGVEAELAGLVDVHEVLLRAQDRSLLAQYLIVVYAGRWIAGEPRPGADEMAARFVAIGELAAYHLTDGAGPIIQRAYAMLSQA